VCVCVFFYMATGGKQLIIYLSLSHVNPITKLLLTKKGNEAGLIVNGSVC